MRNLCGNSSSRESFAKSGPAKLTYGPQESLAAVATIITSLLPGSYIKCHHATKNAPTSLTTALTHVPVHFRVIASVVTSVPSMLDRRRHPRFSPCGKGSGRRPPTGPWCAARRALAALGRVRHPSTSTRGAGLPVNQHSHERLPTGLEALVAFGSGWWQRAQFCLVPTSCTK